MTEQAEIFNYIKKNPIDSKNNTYTTNETLETKLESVTQVYPEIKKNVNRCQLDECNKRLSLTETLCKCKCGNTYCTVHRLSFDHKCTYDFKKDNNHNIYTAIPKKLNKI